jgi:hypothetical protein
MFAVRGVGAESCASSTGMEDEMKRRFILAHVVLVVGCGDDETVTVTEQAPAQPQEPQKQEQTDPLLHTDPADASTEYAWSQVSCKEREAGSRAVEYTATGSHATCDPNWASEGYAEMPYRIRYSLAIPKSRCRGCGSVPWDYTRASVEANYHVRCSLARGLARAWLRKAVRDCYPAGRYWNRPCHTMRVRRFRCRLYLGRYTLWVNCRRGRAFVTWAWGD